MCKILTESGLRYNMLCIFSFFWEKKKMRDHCGFSNDFMNAFSRLISPGRLREILRRHGPAKRCTPTVKAQYLVSALVFHLLRGMGTICENLWHLHGKKLSASSMSERRQNLPWKVFETIMGEALAPLAKEKKHPGAFYRGWRLVGIDGTQFSVSNTPQILSSLSKAASRRMKAAFAKIGAVVLVELGVHNPLAAEIGTEGESEMTLAKRLLSRLPANSLLIADRLYGVGVFLHEFLATLQDIPCTFLVRVRGNLKPRLVETLADGSALMEIKAQKDRGALLVREIRGRVCRANGPWVDVRFWTNLLDPKKYPATELLALYARRWEQEMMYKQLKIDMRQAPLLNSHTPHTAAQEVAALLLAHAVVAQARLQVAGLAQTDVLRISFGKTLLLVRSLWMTLAAGDGIITKKQAQALTRRMLDFLAATILPPRRQRSSPRKVRQPVSSWPRLTENSYSLGSSLYEISPFFS